jgi:hypothetical protein
MNPVVNYFNRIEQGDSATPTLAAYKPIAQKLDAVTAVVLKDLMDVLKATPEHTSRVQLLQNQDRTAGKYHSSKILMKDASPFEQMVAISDWIGRNAFRKDRTLFISAPSYPAVEEGAIGDYIPVLAKKFPTTSMSAMHVVLGSTTGSHKAPKYENWALHDPWDNPSDTRFIYSLEGLEMVRQPNYSAATVLKGNAFELETKIDCQWRYGAKYACVESKGQSKDSQKKQSSAGLNVCAMLETFCNISDPLAKEADICLGVQYEKYSDNGYADNLNLRTPIYQIIKSAQTAIYNNDDTHLKTMMENLTISKIGIPKTPDFKRYIADKILQNGTEN